jgi:hypothetical protein
MNAEQKPKLSDYKLDLVGYAAIILIFVSLVAIAILISLREKPKAIFTTISSELMTNLTD